jgi:hypothetical protein
MKALGQPRLFAVVGRKRWLWTLAGVTLFSGAAMLPAMRTMADHGASLSAFQNAGTVTRSQEIVSEWGDAGQNAAWWQQGLDVPFVLGFGLFLAGACTVVARRARETGRVRLERTYVPRARGRVVRRFGDPCNTQALELIAAEWRELRGDLAPENSMLPKLRLSAYTCDCDPLRPKRRSPLWRPRAVRATPKPCSCSSRR